jgi:hypothetical protein
MALDNDCVYIIGKVKGEDFEECYKKFDAVAVKLHAAGYSAINPLWYTKHMGLDDDNPKDRDYIKRKCISLMLGCDKYYLLADWKQSEFGIAEYELARALDFTYIKPEMIKGY